MGNDKISSEKQIPKIIAFNLPQFHAIPENDEWWGKGFTDWVNVKKAKPLFKNHDQPRVPLGGDYYNLDDDASILKQMETAQRYGLYGFCYYHYWFNGKLLLEKPINRLLNIKDKPLHFCFCWANEPWTRAWDGGDKEILLGQNYGDVKDWEKHFDYFLPFFKDEKYIKIDDKPMLVIYRTNNVPDCDKMIALWDNLCVKNGFKGIYVVEEKNSFQDGKACTESSAVLEFEPMHAVHQCRSFMRRVIDKVEKFFINRKNGLSVTIHNYDNVWNLIIKNAAAFNGEKEYKGAFVDWDNTARKGKQGTLFLGASPEKFGDYFQQLLTNCIKNNSEFVFFNAWNEWAEGTYLEPDEKNGFAYLEKIKSAIGNIENDIKKSV